jgi:hypothetical protein
MSAGSETEMSSLGFTITLEQMERIHEALAAMGDHLRELAVEGGHERTLAVIGTNLAAIQMNLIDRPGRNDEDPPTDD